MHDKRTLMIAGGGIALFLIVIFSVAYWASRPSDEVTVEPVKEKFQLKVEEVIFEEEAYEPYTKAIPQDFESFDWGNEPVLEPIKFLETSEKEILPDQDFISLENSGAFEYNPYKNYYTIPLEEAKKGIELKFNVPTQGTIKLQLPDGVEISMNEKEYNYPVSQPGTLVVQAVYEGPGHIYKAFAVKILVGKIELKLKDTEGNTSTRSSGLSLQKDTVDVFNYIGIEANIKTPIGQVIDYVWGCEKLQSGDQNQSCIESLLTTKDEIESYGFQGAENMGLAQFKEVGVYRVSVRAKMNYGGYSDEEYLIYKVTDPLLEK